MSYLAYVAGFGVAVAAFLWLRDLRIFYRTGLPGYRRAATGASCIRRSPCSATLSPV
ncbi:protein of unknown function [Methanoculleus bourgensis]|uniref:Uncharacterized protein n=1 Tax=Methanoculleus bourgensis TaxID=83986 RepID=A0A0X3BJY7_9EURY|nr:protein of unknown function [Methanoculleus bourgensis]